MKRFFYLIIPISLAIILSSCERNEIEKRLKNNVIEKSHGLIKDYELKSLSIDTITVGKRIAKLKEILEWADANPDIEVLKELRDNEFKVFRASDPGYEFKVLTGELKDASEWCTTIRKVTEKADSLIANWNSVKKYNYDYLWLIMWYGDRSNQFYGTDDSWEMHKLVENNKDNLNEIDKLTNAPKDSIIGYEAIHSYSIKNPLLNNIKVDINEKVFFDKDLNIISSNTTLD